MSLRVSTRMTDSVKCSYHVRTARQDSLSARHDATRSALTQASVRDPCERLPSAESLRSRSVNQHWDSYMCTIERPCFLSTSWLGTVLQIMFVWRKEYVVFWSLPDQTMTPAPGQCDTALKVSSSSVGHAGNLVRCWRCGQTKQERRLGSPARILRTRT